MPSSVHFHRAMEAVACIRDDTPPWADILSATKDLIGADSGSLIMLDGAGDLLHVTHVGLAESTLREYAQHYHKLDVLAHAAARQEAGAWLDSNEVIARATLLRSEFHNDYLRKNDQNQILCLLLERNGTRMTGMSFQRAIIEAGARERLSGGDIGTFVRAFQEALASKQSAIVENLLLLEDVFTGFGEAACLVSRGGAVLRMSPLCGSLLDNRQSLTTKRGRLYHPNEAVLPYVLDSIDRAIQTRTRTRATVALSLGSTLLLDISPAPTKLQMVGEPLALVRLRKNSEGGSIETSCLIATFGITPAEARVLAGLAGGLSPVEYAVQNAVSENTVRKQIASLKSKMNCHRVVDLVRQAMLTKS